METMKKSRDGDCWMGKHGRRKPKNPRLLCQIHKFLLNKESCFYKINLLCCRIIWKLETKRLILKLRFNFPSKSVVDFIFQFNR